MTQYSHYTRMSARPPACQATPLIHGPSTLAQVTVFSFIISVNNVPVLTLIL